MSPKKNYSEDGLSIYPTDETPITEAITEEDIIKSINAAITTTQNNWLTPSHNNGFVTHSNPNVNVVPASPIPYPLKNPEEKLPERDSIKELMKMQTELLRRISVSLDKLNENIEQIKYDK